MQDTKFRSITELLSHYHKYINKIKPKPPYFIISNFLKNPYKYDQTQ